MKTITLDEVAYNRLKAWKRTPQESFSAVIRRLVPEAGTLGAFMQFVDQNRTDALAANERLEQALSEPAAGRHDPWT